MARRHPVERSTNQRRPRDGLTPLIVLVLVLDRFRFLFTDLDHLHRAGGKRLQKAFAVVLAQDPIIQNNDDAFIGLGPNKATDPLSQFQDRFGKGIFGERISAVGLDIFELGFDQRMIGNGERESGNDDVGKRFPGTSTPVQKLSVPNKTPLSDFLNRSSMRVRDKPFP